MLSRGIAVGKFDMNEGLLECRQGISVTRPQFCDFAALGPHFADEFGEDPRV